MKPTLPVPSSPSSPDTAITASSPTGRPETLELEADHRRHAEIENAIRDLKYGVGLNHMPSGRFAANAAWLAVQVMAHDLARWTARIDLGEQIGDPPRPSGGGSSPWSDGSPAPHAG